MSKNCIIVHGCPTDEVEAMNPESRTYDKHWIPWIKQQLESHGIKTEVPIMPAPWSPVYNDFKKKFDSYIIDSDSILVGHSCGCAFLVRWLGDTKKKIAKLILVAPWKINDENDANRKEFYSYDIDKSIKDRVGEIIMFTSNDEEQDGKDSLKLFNDVLGGEIVLLQDHGHYCMDDMGTNEFPELLNEIEKNII